MPRGERIPISSRRALRAVRTMLASLRRFPFIAHRAPPRLDRRPERRNSTTTPQDNCIFLPLSPYAGRGWERGPSHRSKKPLAPLSESGERRKSRSGENGIALTVTPIAIHATSITSSRFITGFSTHARPLTHAPARLRSERSHYSVCAARRAVHSCSTRRSCGR